MGEWKKKMDFETAKKQYLKAYVKLIKLMLERLNSTANFFTTMEISERNLLGKSVYLALFFGVRFAFFPYEDKN